MIELQHIRGSRLSEASKGDLFLARSRSDPTFIVGTLNEKFLVAVNLSSGTYEFVDLEVTTGRRGILIEKTPIFIDPDSRIACRSSQPKDAPLGSLVAEGTNIGIVAGNIRDSSRHFVSLINDQIADDCPDGIAFTDWAICLSDESGQWAKLHENGPNAGSWASAETGSSFNT